MSKSLAPALAAARLDPDWIKSLAPAELLVADRVWQIWARAEQRIPSHKWKRCGFDGARGWGKTQMIGAWLNDRIRAGKEQRVALLAPTEASTEGVQFRALVDAAKPWFQPKGFSHNGHDGLVWPNGVQAISFTSATAGGARGFNFSAAWLTEAVVYKHSTRDEAVRNVEMATRLGDERVIWDSTSKGRNPILEGWRADNARDPHVYPIIGGTTFENPIYSDGYLRRQWSSYTGVRREEELLGKHFSQEAGALWSQDVIDRTRVEFAPPSIELEHVGIDPASSSASERADETGLSRCGRGRDGHVYVLEDRSGRYTPDRWGDIALDWMPRGGRCTIETNQGADMAVHVLRSRAETRGLRVVDLGREGEWPALEAGIVHVRRWFSRESKGTRAEGPAVEWEAGRCHLVGEYPDLEREMNTYVPSSEGRQKSPNRLDAMVFCVTELRGLSENAEPRDTAGASAAAARVSELLAGRAKGTLPRRVEPIPGGWSRPRMGF